MDLAFKTLRLNHPKQFNNHRTSWGTDP